MKNSNSLVFFNLKYYTMEVPRSCVWKSITEDVQVIKMRNVLEIMIECLSLFWDIKIIILRMFLVNLTCSIFFFHITLAEMGFHKLWEENMTIWLLLTLFSSSLTPVVVVVLFCCNTQVSQRHYHEMWAHTRGRQQITWS